MKNFFRMALVGLASSLFAIWLTSGAEEGPDTTSDEDTPVILEVEERPKALSQDRPFRVPDFSRQEQALGYRPDTFATPKGMEDRVAFWVDIYTKYSTDQGLLHDSRYLHLVYETVDFSEVGRDSRARKRLLTARKKAIADRLVRLQSVKSPGELSGEDLRYWQMFSNIEEPKKFIEASRKGRLRFQLGQSDRFAEGIYQSGRHLLEMEEIFRQEAMPLELTRLPFVESSFNLRARSKVGASGIWQFMRSTARLYMRMDPSVDERNDPIRSTRSAARKLRDNYRMLESWPLAVTGYNHGPSGVARLVKKYKTSDIAELTDVRKGRFGFASANFYASFLAALQVEREAEKHFGVLKWMGELRGEEIKLEKPILARQLVEWFEGNQELAELYNPHVRPHVWKTGRILPKNFIRVPKDRLEYVLAQIKDPEVQTEVAQAKDEVDSRLAQGEAYVIQEGETLSHIADRFGVKLRKLLEINDIENPRRIRSGQKIFIPVVAN